MTSWTFGSGESRRVDGREKLVGELRDDRTVNRHR